VKLNIDASFWLDEGMASTGIVPDWSGQVLLTTWRWLRNCATREANEWIKKPIEVEMDCQVLARCLVSPVTDRAA
jgi:hypothetical protein